MNWQSVLCPFLISLLRSTYLPIIIYPPYIIIRKKEDITSVTCTCKRSCIRVILLPQRTLASSIKNNIGPRSYGIYLDILPETSNSTVLFLVLTFWIGWWLQSGRPFPHDGLAKFWFRIFFFFYLAFLLRIYYMLSDIQIVKLLDFKRTMLKNLVLSKG